MARRASLAPSTFSSGRRVVRFNIAPYRLIHSIFVPCRYQYKDYVLFCPFAFRMLEGPILAKDLAVEYKYLANTSEWFYIARKNAERVIRNMTSLTKGKVILQTSL